MLVPINWLNDYVEVSNLDVRALEEKLIMSGSNTENITFIGRDITGVVVSKIIKIEPHPDADKLVVCQTDIGSDVLQIVTGAKNMAEGDYVPVALHGATLAGGLKIKKGKLRGVVSNGMFCSYAELGFDDKVIPKAMQDGLMILKGDYTLGEDIFIATQLKDQVIEFEITPNRPDCLSILGMAKETAATLDKSIKNPDVTIVHPQGDVAEMATADIKASDLCSRYAFKLVQDVKVEPSPLWLQNRLIKAGMRPINNIVDITNYVLLELGQPIHAFDYDKISGNKIIVRRANDGECIRTLDGSDRVLDNEMLLITDHKEPLAIAGIMGGSNSEISEQTKNLLIEVASFSKTNIRETSKKLGLRTEASSRFEKGISSESVTLTLNRVCHLIEKLGAGKIVGGTIDVYPVKQVIKEVHIRTERVNALLGTDISSNEMMEYLKKLGCSVTQTDDGFNVKPPHFRLDLQIEADYIEEIARMFGYDKLPNTQPQDAIRGYLTERQLFKRKLQQKLSNMGFYEMLTYSFISPNAVEMLNDNVNSNIHKLTVIRNPLGEEYSVMRPSLLPSVLQAVGRNINHKIDQVLFYDMGNIFVQENTLNAPLEIQKLAIAVSDKSYDFYTLKAAVDALFKALAIRNVKFTSCVNHHTFHPGRCASVAIGDKNLGYMGQIHPTVAQNFNLTREVYALEFDVNTIFEAASVPIKYQPLPKYPAATRDIAVELDVSITHQQVLDTIKANGGELLDSAKLFDVYQGDQITNGKKSMAYALSFRAEDRTLVEDDIINSYNNVLKALIEVYDAKLRQI